MFLVAGGLQAIAELLQLDHDANGNTTEQYNITMRRYACMALTNLTFGDGTNKALLCSMKTCMRALVAQLQSPNEDLRQVAASVLRNLSWRADLASKKILREVGAVTALMQASMEVGKESTLKSILSALWNLSAHCSENKADICAVNGALGFLVTTLTYKSPSKTLAIIENGGGILRNISSHIAVREEYRKILREHGCLQILLKHLRSPSLTIVSNACGTLWNLSARCPEDQKALWELGAVSMLRNLVHSKHKMISMGSAAALKNLLAAKPSMMSLDGDRHKQSNMPTLHVRKQRALEEELDQTLAETCDNVESPSGSPTEQRKHIHVDASKNYVYSGDQNVYQTENDHRRSYLRNNFSRNPSADTAFILEAKMRSPSRPVSRSGSQDSVGSVHSDISHDRVRTHSVLAKSNKLLAERQNMNGDRKMGDRRAGPNSRIMQVMQEVAMHAGIEPGSYLRETQSAENTPPTMRRSQTNPTLRDAANVPARIPPYMKNGQQFSPRHSIAGETHLNQRVNQQPSQPQYQKQSDSYQSITKRMENLHLVENDENQEEPINYSLKYADGPSQGKNANQNAGFIPAAKVGNYMPGMRYNGQSKVNAANTQSPTYQSSNQFDEYNEQDADDQPTNYGIRFAEQVDDGHISEEQPINYSTRFQEAGGEEAPESSDIQQEHDEMNGDTIKTFCTEGTPYLSTVPSMEDLTGIGKDSGQEKSKAPDSKTVQEKSYSGHFPESHSSKSTEHQTSSTVVRGKQTESAANIQNNNVARVNETVPQPSLYSYNDNVTASPGSERPMQYCEEGTPVCFSRVSSLSSLHSTDAHDHPDNNQNRGDLTLQSIDENQCLDTPTKQTGNTTLRPDQNHSFQSPNTTAGSVSSGTNTPGHHKSVTFDDNNQIQETPLMFSRCSSLGSLSSFDAHSVHSSVVSEYSHRASEVVSPSDLPDSPSESMPPTPGRKSPVKFDSIPNNSQPTKPTQTISSAAQQQNSQCAKSGEESKVELMRPIPNKIMFPDSPKNYVDEGTPDFSCATSLSGLDIDEPEISKDPELQRVPLGPEEGEEDAHSSGEPSQLEATVVEKTTIEVESDNDSGSEGDEDMLAECINMAMPMPSKAKGKRKSLEKNEKQQIQMPRDMPRSPYLKTYVDLGEPSDTVRQYGTEDTPLNYSRDEELSNLSFNSSTGELINLGDLGENLEVDDRSDISSIADDGDDCEDLLSEAIAAAMPKKIPKPGKTMDRVAEGAVAKSKAPIPRVIHHLQHSETFSMAARAVGQSLPPQSDSVKTYAEEGTPINFSRATSLSELSQLDPDGASEDHSRGSEIDDEDKLEEQDTFYIDESRIPIEVTDSPKPYGMEGTPLSFSRNDSLSSLSCDEDAELDNAKDNLRTARLPPSNKGSPRALLTPKQRLLGRLTSPSSKNRSPGGRAQRNLAFSKPQPQSPLAMSPPKPDFDQLQTFAVEGTPHCFSRNSSLSSLNSSDHDHEVAAAAVNLSEIHDEDVKQGATGTGNTSGDQIGPDSFMVEDTPANFSRNSSLSSLSVESLGYEPTPSESALLEECINAAMPKTKAAKKKTSKIPRNCPTSSSTPKDKFLKPKTPAAFEKPAPKTPSPSSEGSPKNVQSSQHGTEVGKQNDVEPEDTENIWRQRSPSLELQSSPKQLKDYSNQEKVLGALMEAETVQSLANVADIVDDNELQQLADDFDNKLCISNESNEAKYNAEDLDNKLDDMDLANSDMIASAIFREASEIAEGFAEAADLHNESFESDGPIVAKEEIESTKESPVDAYKGYEDLGCVPFDGSFHDITKETFPDMGISLVSSTMSALGEDNPLVTTRAKCIAEISDGEESQGDYNQDDSYSHDEATVIDPDSKRSSVLTDIDLSPHEITLEEEKALEENAELLIRELSNVHLSQLSSSVTSEKFIENECISLVSNDTDTASEVSVSLSCSSKAMSEKASEASAAKSPASRPRILKAGEKSVLETKANEEDSGKAVRGKRKSLAPRSNTSRTGSSPAPLKNDPNKSRKVTPPSKPPANVRSKPPAGNTKATVAKTPSKTTPPVKALNAAAKVPAKTPAKSTTKPTAGVKPTAKVSAVVAPMNSAKATPNMAGRSGIRKDSPVRTGTASPRTGSPADRSRSGKPGKQLTSTPAGKKPQARLSVGLSSGKGKENSKAKSSDCDRPKPPIKQGTFTKDSPTQNAPEIAPGDEDNGSETASNRSSAELKYSNDTQEKTPADKSSPRSSKTDTAGPSTTPAVANLKQNSSKASGGKSSSTGNLAKGSGKTSVTKTASGSSLNKTGSNTSINKQGNGFKVPAKPPLKKGSSSSSQSLKKEENVTNPSLKTTSSTPVKKGNEKGGRATVPVASKIASLWRKGDSDKTKSSPKEDKKSTPKKDKEKSGDVKLKFLRRSLASSQPSKEIKEEKKSGKPGKDGLRKSSTYDKLPSNDDKAGKVEISQNNTSPTNKNVWRRTYTIQTEDEVQQEVKADIEQDKPSKSPRGVWTRRDGDKTPLKSNIPGPVKLSPEQGSDRSKPSPPSAFPAKTGISPPGAKGPMLTSPNAAIVAPFNYVPTQSPPRPEPKQEEEDNPKTARSANIESPSRPMTKTEMLIARRRQSYLNSVNKTSDDAKDDEEARRTACLVTTV